LGWTGILAMSPKFQSATDSQPIELAWTGETLGARKAPDATVAPSERAETIINR
jgi:hypothetical protein